MQQTTGLIGMGEICQYVKRSPATVLKMIRVNGLPAEKIGGIWESDRELIDQWRRDVISGSVKPKVSNIDSK